MGPRRGVLQVNSIYRISVPVEDYQELDLTGPPISVAPDRGGSDGKFDLWFEHYDRDPSPCAIYVFGTGHPIPWNAWNRSYWHFLGTVVNSYLVWHVYVGPRKGEGVWT
jgi:hypothetical protein